MTRKQLTFLASFYHLDPRWLYLAVTVVLLIPLIFHIPNPPVDISDGTKGVYDTVALTPEDKVVLIDSSWDLGSKPECMSILEAVVTDLITSGHKFVVLATAVYAPPFAMDVITPIAEKAGYVYGRDWVHLGFIQPPADNVGLLVQSFYRDLHRTRPVDINGWPIGDAERLPLMQQVRTAEDIHMVIAINYTAHMEWFTFGRAEFGVPAAFGCAAMMVPYYQVFVESGQLNGLLAGNRGAYEYEALTEHYGLGSVVMMSFAFGMPFLIVAVIFGNIGFWAEQRLRRME